MAKLGILNSASTVLELGCGISGIIGLCLGPLIGTYVLTDQDYVLKLVNQNLAANKKATSASKGRKSVSKPKRGTVSSVVTEETNVVVKTLDWETDEVTPALTGDQSTQSFDVVIACDCIYNDALTKPLVQTCIDVCNLRASDRGSNELPTACVVAQQLRSPEVFEAWLKEFNKAFDVWRLPDEELIVGLKADSGFVVHVGILR